jgi:hypothetical protein
MTEAADDLAALRTAIAETQRELTRVATAPLPLKEAEEALREALASLASRNVVDPVLRSFTATPLPGADAVASLLGVEATGPDGLVSALASHFGTQLVTAWRARLKHLYATDPALAGAIPLADRPAQLTALRQRLLELEVEEEQLICAAARHGREIARRAEADPRAIFHPDTLSAT